MLSSVILRATSCCAAVLLLAACEQPAGSGADRSYGLATIDGDSLPAALTVTPGPLPVFDVLNGSLVLHGDGTVTEEWTLRCRTDLPEWVTCNPQGDQLRTRSGTHTAGPIVVRIYDEQFLSTSTVASGTRIILETNVTGNSSARASFEYVR